MLSLEDARWNTLTTVYGPAKDIPKLLARWEKDPGNFLRVSYRLFESLVHQWDACDAAYAALPHIVRIGRAQGIREIGHFFLLIAGIEGSRSERVPVPDDLREAYLLARQDALALCLETLQNREMEEADMGIVLAAVAGLKGKGDFAYALVNFTEKRRAG